MAAKIESHVKPAQGHSVPGQLNPTKQPDGKPKNDSQSSSGSSVPPLALWIGGWPINGTGHSESRGSASTAFSDLRTSNHPGKTLGENLERPRTPSEAGSPLAPRQESQSGSVSRKNPGAGQDGSIFPSGADSEDLDLMHAVIGDPKKWGDLDAGTRKLKDEDARLDKNPFIAAHLNPEIKSPKHAKANWDKLPGPDHRMFPDYLITEHPEYYSSRMERRNSAPQGNDPHRPSEGDEPLGRAQSLPTDASSSAGPAYAGVRPLPGQGADATGHHPDASIPHQAGGQADSAGAHPDGTAPRAGDGQADANHPDANPSVNNGPAQPQLEELIQENARLQKRARAATYMAYLAGLVGVGAGITAGLVIASEADDPSSNAGS